MISNSHLSTISVQVFGLNDKGLAIEELNKIMGYVSVNN